jgi:hypothetical protein
MTLATNKEKMPNPEELSRASENYLRCLNLPPKSQVLIITDKLPTSGTPNDNLLVRNKMALSLQRQIANAGHRILTLEYDGTRAPADLSEDQLAEQKEQFRQETALALSDLENLDKNPELDRTTTIVY